MNINIEAIKNEIERLKNLTAEEYCKEEVEKIYANFEALRAEEVKELETSLAVAERFEIKLEATNDVEEEQTDNQETE